MPVVSPKITLLRKLYRYTTLGMVSFSSAGAIVSMVALLKKSLLEAKAEFMSLLLIYQIYFDISST
jgi:hypothetical protein